MCTLFLSAVASSKSVGFVVGNSSQKMRMAAVGGAGGGEIAELVPEHIEVAATVDARFIVEDG